MMTDSRSSNKHTRAYSDELISEAYAVIDGFKAEQTAPTGQPMLTGDPQAQATGSASKTQKPRLLRPSSAKNFQKQTSLSSSIPYAKPADFNSQPSAPPPVDYSSTAKESSYPSPSGYPLSSSYDPLASRTLTSSPPPPLTKPSPASTVLPKPVPVYSTPSSSTSQERNTQSSPPPKQKTQTSWGESLLWFFLVIIIAFFFIVLFLFRIA